MKHGKLTACILMLLLVFAALPVTAGEMSSAPHRAPAGYNENDWQRCAAFLEETDESGVKNGVKLDPNYDPNDPGSWGTYMDNGVKKPCFGFTTFSGELRLFEIRVNESDLVGVMDLSNCSKLQSVNCVQNRISGITVAGCSELKILNFLENNVSEVDVTSNPALTDLGTADNPISELDLSQNPLLHNLFVGGGYLRELDLSNNPLLPMQRVYAVGNGTVSYMYMDLGIVDTLALFPGAFPGAVFEGWFTEDGTLVNSDPTSFSVPDPWMYDVLSAHYSGGALPGDMDGNGEVTGADALLALRASMELMTLDPVQLAAGDLDGDGLVTASDALLILRASMDID